MCTPTTVDQHVPWPLEDLEVPFRAASPTLFVANLDPTINPGNLVKVAHMMQLASRLPEHRFLLRVGSTDLRNLLLHHWSYIHAYAEQSEGAPVWPAWNIGFAAVTDGGEVAEATDFLKRVHGEMSVIWLERLRSDPGDVDLGGINWLIASGQYGSTPTNPNWIARLARRAWESGTAFTLTSWGSWEPAGDIVPDGSDPRVCIIYPDGRTERVPRTPNGWTAVRRTNDRYSRVLNGAKYDMVPRGWGDIRGARQPCLESLFGAQATGREDASARDEP